MVRPEIRKTAASLAVASALAVGYSQAHASGFALMEQNASGLGNAYSGAAAAAEDASTIYFNPAGMSFLPAGRQFVLGGVYIDPATKFSDGGTQQSGLGTIPAGVRPLGGTGGDAGKNALVPNAYVASDIAPNLKAGIGLSVPFGLKTEYDPDWMGRFQAIKSEVKTFNINPALSYKLNDSVALAAGLNYQTLNAELTNAVNTVAAAYAGTFQKVLAAGGSLATAQATGAAVGTAVAGLGAPEANVSVKGDDTGYGYNLGAMFQLASQTRLGVSYRSQVKYHVAGTVTFSNAPSAAGLNAIDPTGSLAANFANGNVKLDLTMPDMLSFALSHKLDSNWTILADATRTGWASIRDLTVVRDNGTTLSSTPENFRNTWRVGVGSTYRYNDTWSLKMGVAYDQTPVNDTDRTARLPDQDRKWVSFGAQARLSPATTIDFGYAHLFIKDTSINQGGANPAVSGQLVGTYKESVNILGAQFAHRF
jgi:long-chain fatty acid transport protein